ncbi:MAG: bifunctional diaminohydroxyphosphoribosylaminopyrimidine deaminase/5-amino-6-(5-phosphoribosylamino)uracil reductase RibD, partial [Woeseiaceae bacterium]|nr:bifunctional diaminohydroxyphosphoribosylaminopyrimidine deaminase/5-amino-6-(5-phosphoribosylamino)uracil reductase RibD [Woeseiaceae bacterium]
MARALQLAARGCYAAHPNPMVGCVIASNDEIVGEGWHESAGEAHAEINALREAGELARGATAYVTLEPCAHHGKTPPCVDALVDAGVARVVAAMRDPFGEVDGRGLARLEEAGVSTAVGLMEDQAVALNQGFISRVTRGRPYVRLKVAASIDGAIAMASGESQWITGPEARRDVQRLRARSGAILTGIGTVLADDPSLNVRSADIDTRGRQPLRVVLDSRLQTPATARMLKLPGETLVCCTPGNDATALREAGAEVVEFSADHGLVDAGAVLAELA